MNKAILSLGTNLGDKRSHLSETVKALNKLGKVSSVSSIYQTPAWGFESEDFYNISLILETELNSDSLLKNVLQLELEIGRIRDKDIKGYQARVIDIDIVFFNNEIINTTNLIVPHPRMHQRLFVLVPTEEILPDYKHPILNKKLSELIELCEDDSEISKVI